MFTQLLGQYFIHNMFFMTQTKQTPPQTIVLCLNTHVEMRRADTPVVCRRCTAR